MNILVAALSKLLEPRDRECVCGDLAELKLSTRQAASNILGLVVRRQLAEWAKWGPWSALFGVTAVSGCYLSEFAGRVQTAVLVQIRTYLTYGVAYEPGGVSTDQMLVYTATAICSLLLWFWACGFVLASLSGRSLPITFLAFYSVLRDSWLIRMALAGNITLKHSLCVTMLSRFLPLDAGVMFLVVFAFGCRSGLKGSLMQKTRLLLMVLALALTFLLAWMETWFAMGLAHLSERLYVPTPLFYRVLPLFAVGWPAFCTPLLKRKAVNSRHLEGI